MSNKPKIQIQFPSLLMIPVISLIGIILKIFGCTRYDWLHVIISVPVAIYFLWCVGYCMLAAIGFIIIKILLRKDNA